MNSEKKTKAAEQKKKEKKESPKEMTTSFDEMKSPNEKNLTSNHKPEDIESSEPVSTAKDGGKKGKKDKTKEVSQAQPSQFLKEKLAEIPSSSLAAERGQYNNSLMSLFQKIEINPLPKTKDIYDTYRNEDVNYRIIQTGHSLHNNEISHSKGCVQILQAVYSMINDLNIENDTISTLQKKIDMNKQILSKYVPLDKTVENIFEFLLSMTQEFSELDEKNRKLMLDRVNEFQELKFGNGEALLIKNTMGAICDGDSILVPNASSVLEKVFGEAHEKGKKFSLTILANSASPENTTMALNLEKKGIPITVSHINNIAEIVQSIHKVFVNGICIFSNGSLQTAAGTAAVAMVAHKFRKPVYAVIRTIRFSELSFMDSLQVNQSEKLPKIDNGFRLLYDLVPDKYISVVLTEIGKLPPYSVPIVIKQMKITSY